MTRKNGRTPSDPPDASDTDGSHDAYRVGPGRPPKEFQFKPGQSGNPLGARRKASSLVTDLRATFERALRRKVTLRQGDKEKTVTMAHAGIEQLVTQFAKGDRHARRDVLAMAQMFGIDLGAGRAQATAGETPRMSEAEATALIAALSEVFYHVAPAEDVDPYGDNGGEVVALQPIKPPADPEE
jgi:uncharacterized protein DUF5681